MQKYGATLKFDIILNQILEFSQSHLFLLSQNKIIANRRGMTHYSNAPSGAGCISYRPKLFAFPLSARWAN
jgi:hypothetical protein